ncbi:MAG: N-acetylneuraminate synthase family protein [Balneolaceae bacterium]|nr:N-acetylneuraminate synthase family protein [Balneolaceae bacterium]
MTRFVAEVSSNHNADLERCKAFVRRSADMGWATPVKFQALPGRPSLRTRNPGTCRRWWRAGKSGSCRKRGFPELAETSREAGVEMGCTPFHLEAVDFLEPYVDFFKIASYELLWDDLLARCASTGLPVILSTGHGRSRGDRPCRGGARLQRLRGARAASLHLRLSPLSLPGGEPGGHRHPP